jgi:hypothetical protein
VFGSRDTVYFAPADGWGVIRRVTLPVSFNPDVAFTVNAWSWTR